MTASENAPPALPSMSGILTSKLVNNLSSPIDSRSPHPRDADGSTMPSQNASSHNWTMQGTRLTSHLPVPACSTAPEKIVIEAVSPRPSTIAFIHYLRVALDWSSLNAHQTLVSSSPAHPHGTVGRVVFFRGPLTTCNNNVRPIYFLGIGFSRTLMFIGDLRTDR